MAVGTEDPSVQRRRLRNELRALRSKADLTQRQVAEAMDWSPSKVIRIENGDVGISVNDLRALLDLFGVTAKQRRDELVEMARASRRDPLTDYREKLSAGYRTFISYEAAASLIRNYEPELIPGLLQTEEYAREILGSAYEFDKDDVDFRWEVRKRRQELHEAAEPPEMFFIIDEPVIRRRIGGPNVMRRQLERLKDWSREPHLTLRVLPFSAGAHPAMTGPFVVLEFPDPKDDPIVNLEDITGGSTIRDDPELASATIERFYKLEDIALSEQESLDMIDDAINDLNPSKQPATATPNEA
jgi:transcriptional regulator with XRE-family HTH domain